MINKRIREEYLAAFNECIIMDECGSGTIFVEDEDGNAYSLNGLSNEQIMDKIERSKKAGVNLFYNECPKWHPRYDKDKEY